MDSPLGITMEPDEFLDDEDEDSLLCECQLVPTEEEEASNSCAACGKPIY